MMFFLAPLLMKLKLSEGLAKAGSVIILLLVALALLWWLRADAYSDGVRATDAKWEEASRRLQEQARRSADRADEASERRVEEFTERQAMEKERLDEAEQNGSSPFDVLFGPGDGVR